MKITLFILLLLPQLLLGQAGFERVYLFNDTNVRIMGVHPTDSSYYFLGNVGNNTNRLAQVFGELNLNGDVKNLYIQQVDTSLQYSGYTRNDLKLNNEGNFVFCYLSYASSGLDHANTPRLKIQKPTGEIVLDTLYSELWSVDSLFFFHLPFPPEIELLPDGTMLFGASFFDYKTDTPDPMGFNGEMGSFVMKIDVDGTILWTKKYKYLPFIPYGPLYAFINIDVNMDGSFMVSYIDYKYDLNPNFGAGDWAKVYFTNCDVNGNIINTETFQETQFCVGSPAYQKIDDTSSFFTFFDTEIYDDPPLMNLFKIQPCIARLNLSKQILWKQRIAIDGGNDPVESASINDIVSKNGNVYCSVLLGDIINPTKLEVFLSLNSLSIETGEFNWQRRFNLFPDDSASDPEFTVYDIDTTFDGGFILAGNCFRWSQNQGDKPRQYGYILKTNCLGFLGSPQAAVTVLSSSLDSVVFVNSSIQAGSYFWDFGDGNSLQTGENLDTISHVYSQAGTYTVKLIAEGCNGDNDTLTFSHSIASPPQSYGDGTLLSVFPNPTISGQDATIYIGNISGTHDLVVTDLNGKKVTSYSIEQGETTYFVPTTKFAKGMYQFSLLQNGEVREVEKLIIE